MILLCNNNRWQRKCLCYWRDCFRYPQHYCTIKYDKNGNELWVATYNGPANGSDEAYAIAVDDHDDVYVTGSSYTTDDDLDYCTVKYYSVEFKPGYLPSAGLETQMILPLQLPLITT